MWAWKSALVLRVEIKFQRTHTGILRFLTGSHDAQIIPEWEWCYIRTKIEFILLFGSYFGVVL